MHLSELYHEVKEPYLYWRGSMDHSRARICWNPPAPKQYLRLVTADLLGRSAYGDWKAVHADPVKKAADLALVSDTVKRLRARLASSGEIR